MDKSNRLNQISDETIQKVYQCFSQAVAEDYQEADSHLNLETHISKAFLIWDLIYRNLIHEFSESDILCSTTKQGMWEVMLLYDKSSNLLLSFMKEARFTTIQSNDREQIPKYMAALVSFNNDLQAKKKQQRLPLVDDSTTNDSKLIALLNKLCMSFSKPVKSEIQHHVLVIFSTYNGMINTFKACVLDRDLDVVEEQDWLLRIKPVMSNIIEKATKEEINYKKLELTSKAMQRIEQKGLVGLKTNNDESDQQST